MALLDVRRVRQSKVAVVPQKIQSFTKQMHARGKCVRTEAPPNFIYSSEGIENIDKTFEKNMVVATIFGFGSQLHERKILAPLTSVVLNGNLLVRLAIEC